MQSINKQKIINQFLPKDTSKGINKNMAIFSPSNIALSKYWGKRNKALNLPQNGSLSISLGHLGSETLIIDEGLAKDCVYLNNTLLRNNDAFSQKVISFLNLFRRNLSQPVSIYTKNNIPTAAGLASSASGFAALMLAINEFYQFNLSNDVLSAFARMGSGSASRSIFKGFVKWDKGEQVDGMDSIAKPLNIEWEDFCIGILKVSDKAKKISSREGMNLTVETSLLYRVWPEQAEKNLITIEQAINDKSFDYLGKKVEQNALTMHATMIASSPSVLYWQPQSIGYMQRIWSLRESGVSVYFTMDAGPNIKLLFLKQSLSDVQQAFPELLIDYIIMPFA